MTRWRIDRSPYFTIPRSSGRRLLATGRLLTKHKPALDSEALDHTHEALEGEVKALSAGYVARHLESASELRLAEGAVDHFVDGLWIALRERVEHWQVFARDGAKILAASQEPGSFDYAAQRSRAEQAAALLTRLLGPSGTDFVRMGYTEQDEYMRTLVQIIDQEQYADALVGYAGPTFYAAVRDAQERYAEMVEGRQAREKGSSFDLRAGLVDLRQAMQGYLIALLALIRDDDPARVEAIRAALRPVDALREQLARERGQARSAGEGDEPGWVDEADLEELLAEEQAVSEELGLPADDDEG